MSWTPVCEVSYPLEAFGLRGHQQRHLGAWLSFLDNSVRIQSKSGLAKPALNGVKTHRAVRILVGL
jgi:hypothetical protein